MRQWHQGKEGFMKVTRIQDKYNPDKVWMIKRYLCGTFYVNQEIKTSCCDCTEGLLQDKISYE